MSSNVVADQARQCLQDSERWFPHTAHSVMHHTVSLIGEVGEFANIIKKADRGSIDLNDAAHRREAIMELTDIYIYLLNLAALLGVDLSKSYVQKRIQNEKRFGNG